MRLGASMVGDGAGKELIDKVAHDPLGVPEGAGRKRIPGVGGVALPGRAFGFARDGVAKIQSQAFGQFAEALRRYGRNRHGRTTTMRLGRSTPIEESNAKAPVVERSAHGQIQGRRIAFAGNQAGFDARFGKVRKARNARGRIGTAWRVAAPSTPRDRPRKRQRKRTESERATTGTLPNAFGGTRRKGSKQGNRIRTG